MVTVAFTLRFFFEQSVYRADRVPWCWGKRSATDNSATRDNFLFFDCRVTFGFVFGSLFTVMMKWPPATSTNSGES